jgi:predicted acyl esterase
MPPGLRSNIDIEFDVVASMRDGTWLRANVYRPGGADLQPARQTILHDAEHPSRIVLPLVPRP